MTVLNQNLLILLFKLQFKKIKDKLFGKNDQLEISYEYKSALNSLVYPVNKNTATLLVSRYFHSINVDFWRLVDLRTRHYLLKLTRDDLILFHKYCCSLLLNKQSIIVFHQILRHDIRSLSILNIILIKRYCLSFFLLSSILPASVPRRIGTFICILILRNFSRSSNPTSTRLNFRGDRFSILGGGNDHNNATSNICSRSRIATINDSRMGANVDVIYLRGERIQYFESNQSKFDPRREAIYSFKILPTSKQMLSLDWVMTHSLDFMDYGSLNAVPAACWDCFVNGCKSLSLYQTDFNLGGWMKGYRPIELPDIQPTLIFGAHPAYLQFIFVKSLSRFISITLAPNPYITISDSPRKFWRNFNKVYPASITKTTD